MSTTQVRTLNISVILLVTCAAPAAGGATVVSTRSLLNEMTDLERLATFPEPAFTCRQFSSYDRAAKSPSDNWFANADHGQFLRVEQHEDRSEHVMMDADGPGAIVRMWSANPKGTLRIYIDGAKKPALEASMTRLLGGEIEGIPFPIAGERSRGWNCFLPIPYANHCKVTCDESAFYYHVNYRTYAPGTQVNSFDMAELSTLFTRIEELASALASPRAAHPTEANAGQTLHHLDVPPGDAGEIELSGPAAIQQLSVRAEAQDLVLALRQIVLRIDFDGAECVTCPLGDFFGAAPGLNPYASLPMGVTRDGWMSCRWVMPFRKRARLRFCNLGEQPATITVQMASEPVRWSERSMHFHVKWRAERNVSTRPMQDWNYLTAHGQGVFVGSSFSIANPTKRWWGEGDEKIYIDGESFPSHFGTGTEDYFGYAWCCNEPFTHAYHNQPRCDGPGNYGHTSVNRWHIIDRIPFNEGLRFDMELWHWQECRVNLSVAAYWYARPGGEDGFTPLRTGDLRLNLLPEYVPFKVKGAIEGEDMRVISKTASVRRQNVDGCSNETHLWWHDGTRIGDRLLLGFEVEKTGRYRVMARFVKAKDYAIVKLAVNDEPAGDPIDLYHDGIKVSQEVDLGALQLLAGENRICVDIVSANEMAVRNYLFGLDYIRLQPATGPDEAVRDSAGQSG